MWHSSNVTSQLMKLGINSSFHERGQWSGHHSINVAKKVHDYHVFRSTSIFISASWFLWLSVTQSVH